MPNRELFEMVVALKDKDFICYPIITKYQKQQQIETDDFELVHLVYAVQEDKPVLFYIRFINSTIELSKNNFSSYLAQINKSSFNELLYLVSYYGFFKEDENNLSLFKVSFASKKTECYFENTFGKLLYHYQLEQLYCSITQSRIEEAVAFRKAINLKRHNAFEKAKIIVLPTGESLYDIISEYRYREFTLYPKVKEALALYTFLHNK
jgi:hypothetical protein